MQITRFMDDNGDVHLGTEVNGKIATVLKGDLFSGVEKTRRKTIIAQILAPVDPPAIFCIGLNYRSHAEETNMPLPKYPVVFMKNPASVIGQGMPIIIPESCKNPPQVDYEVELAVVMGKPARNVSPEDALDHVAGYCVGNDVSARIWQMQGGGNQWVRGKTFDTFCPLGPYLVTADEIPDPDHLNIQCRLNGSLMQAGNTSDMIFSTAKLIAFLSEDTTLLPGTVILTGTPSGVGYSRKPPMFLKSGDLLEMTIEKIGTLVNVVE
jgi:2-keto-4-pentenoate hydratase/2-oxohepta-3-ene-1,7-dioic acid hydratase in catechol pathway